MILLQSGGQTKDCFIRVSCEWKRSKGWRVWVKLDLMVPPPANLVSKRLLHRAWPARFPPRSVWGVVHAPLFHSLTLLMSTHTCMPPLDLGTATKGDTHGVRPSASSMMSRFPNCWSFCSTSFAMSKGVPQRGCTTGVTFGSV